MLATPTIIIYYHISVKVAIVSLIQHVAILAQCLKNDILSVTGPDFSSRLELLKFVADELETREIYARIGSNQFAVYLSFREKIY